MNKKIEDLENEIVQLREHLMKKSTAYSELLIKFSDSKSIIYTLVNALTWSVKTPEIYKALTEYEIWKKGLYK